MASACREPLCTALQATVGPFPPPKQKGKAVEEAICPDLEVEPPSEEVPNDSAPVGRGEKLLHPPVSLQGPLQQALPGRALAERLGLPDVVRDSKGRGQDQALGGVVGCSSDEGRLATVEHVREAKEQGVMG